MIYLHTDLPILGLTQQSRLHPNIASQQYMCLMPQKVLWWYVILQHIYFRVFNCVEHFIYIMNAMEQIFMICIFDVKLPPLHHPPSLHSGKLGNYFEIDNAFSSRFHFKNNFFCLYPHTLNNRIKMGAVILKLHIPVMMQNRNEYFHQESCPQENTREYPM